MSIHDFLCRQYVYQLLLKHKYINSIELLQIYETKEDYVVFPIINIDNIPPFVKKLINLVISLPHLNRPLKRMQPLPHTQSGDDYTQMLKMIANTPLLIKQLICSDCFNGNSISIQECNIVHLFHYECYKKLLVYIRFAHYAFKNPQQMCIKCRDINSPIESCLDKLCLPCLKLWFSHLFLTRDICNCYIKRESKCEKCYSINLRYKTMTSVQKDILFELYIQRRFCCFPTIIKKMSDRKNSLIHTEFDFICNLCLRAICSTEIIPVKSRRYFVMDDIVVNERVLIENGMYAKLCQKCRCFDMVKYDNEGDRYRDVAICTICILNIRKKLFCLNHFNPDKNCSMNPFIHSNGHACTYCRHCFIEKMESNTPAVAVATSVADATTLVADDTPSVADATPSVADDTPSVADATPSVAEATPSVAEAIALDSDDEDSILELKALQDRLAVVKEHINQKRLQNRKRVIEEGIDDLIQQRKIMIGFIGANRN